MLIQLQMSLVNSLSGIFLAPETVVILKFELPSSQATLENASNINIAKNSTLLFISPPNQIPFLNSFDME